MRLIDLVEAREVVDLRHPPADLPYWPVGEDPQYVDPADGFHFTYHRGKLALASTQNSYYSAKVTGQADPGMWNMFGGLVNLRTRTITIAKESYTRDGRSLMRQRDVPNVKEVQKALTALKPYGIAEDFRLKGLPPGSPKTVGDLLQLDDPTDKVIAGNPMVMYHGTSGVRWEQIARQGLRPGHTPNVYSDLVPGYSEHNIYLSLTPKAAEFYGKRQAAKDRDDSYVVLRITVPDMARLIPDDRWISRQDLRPTPRAMRASGREAGEFAYRGAILPKHISLLSQKKYTGRHVSFARGDRVRYSLGNRTTTGHVEEVYGDGNLIDIRLDDGTLLNRQSSSQWSVISPDREVA